MSLKKKGTSLAETINSLMTTVPSNFDSDDDDLTKAKTVERDESEASDNEYRPSSIRKNTAPLLAEEDERYAAKKISRKKAFSGKTIVESSDELSDEDESFSGEEAEEEEGSDPEPQSASGEEELDSEEEGSGDEGSKDEESEDQESEDEESEDDDNPLRRGRNSKTGIQLISDTNLRSEIEKGNCVRNQLKVWENLLETRIRLQQCLQTSNKMPQQEVHVSFKSDPEFQKSTAETTLKLSSLLENLLEMQSILLNKNPETRNILVKGKKRKAEKEEIDDSMDEEISSDTEDEFDGRSDQDPSDKESLDDSEDCSKSPKKKMKLEDFERVLAQNHEAYSQYRDSLIQKWNDKTRISAGNATKGSQTQSVVKQIEFILNDKEKLLKKTRVKRSEYEIVGKDISDELDEDGRHIQEYDSEIFDDDDFYHQLLRELIEHKSAGITDPIQLSKQWIQLQSMRNKLKRKIDTRATKGRRIRYVVHKKLVNFMAPITIYDTWSENAKNELYNSLFGKTFSAEEKKVSKVAN